MRLQLQWLVGKSWRRRLEHLHGRVAADLRRPDDLPFAIATCQFRRRGDVAGANPLPSSRITEPKWVELDRRRSLQPRLERCPAEPAEPSIGCASRGGCVGERA